VSPKKIAARFPLERDFDQVRAGRKKKRRNPDTKSSASFECGKTAHHSTPSAGFLVQHDVKGNTTRKGPSASDPVLDSIVIA
jgi:hypothetical protein